MLKYIQKSTDDNVTNQDIATIQQLATKVKRKKEVGINYMKSWEYEKWVRDDAFKSGYEDGFDAGKSDGFEDGFEAGKSNGFNDGFNDGFIDGADKTFELIRRLKEAEREEDIEKAACDKEFRQQLLKEFGLC